VREAVSQVLRGAGCEVACARDGQEAFDILQDSAALPDVVITDLMMPGLNGLETIGTMRDRPHWRSIPVIVITAFGIGDDLPAGWHILHKPFEQELLLGAVERATRPNGISGPRSGRRSKLVSRSAHRRPQRSHRTGRPDARSWLAKESPRASV
jgi:CheY-like chemotaxis protein